MSLPDNDTLNWLAIRYVLDELPVAEREAFEERLADDLAACEAVTVASRLAVTMRVGFADLQSKSVPSRRIETRSRSGSWFAVVGAIIAASVMWCLFSLPEVALKRPLNSTAELVSLWRTGTPETNVDLDEDDSELPRDPIALSALNLDQIVAAEIDLDDHAAVESSLTESVPHWMLAAVSLEVEEMFDGLHEKVQEN